MKPKATTDWICAECGERIPFAFKAVTWPRGPRAGRVVKVKIKVRKAALADIYAHVWAHEEHA